MKTDLEDIFTVGPGMTLLEAYTKAIARVAELEADRKELRRVICTLQPRLNETECECGDDGPCDKHLVEVTLANYPKR